MTSQSLQQFVTTKATVSAPAMVQDERPDVSIVSAVNHNDYGFYNVGDPTTTSTAQHVDRDDDMFSDYGTDDGASYYSTLLESATAYYWENGRRFHSHNSSRYRIPNDATELDRDDMKHHVWQLVTDGRLHLSPLVNPHKILDLGTGSGIWAIQMAERYSAAEVTGTDISPVQPLWVPPNLIFEIDDLSEEWLYNAASYDFINCRFNFLAVDDWPRLCRQAFRTLKRGGYIELTEIGMCPRVTATDIAEQPENLWKFIAIIAERMRQNGFQSSIVKHFRRLLEEAGFVDVVEEKFSLPWGTWPEDKMSKTIGYWQNEQLKQGLHGVSLGFLGKDKEYSVQDIENFINEVRQEMDDPKYHIMDEAYVVYGRKP